MEKTGGSQRKTWHKLMDRNVVFSLALASGVAAIIAVLLILNSGWSFVTFNSSTFATTVQQFNNQTYISQLGLNSTEAANAITVLEGESTLAVAIQQSLFVFLPLLTIAGAFMMVTAFYLRSRKRKVASYGVAFSIIFTLLFFVGLLIYLPIAPSNVSVFFSYLGLFTGAAVEMVAAYALILVYVILGALASIFGLYRLLLVHENQ